MSLRFPRWVAEYDYGILLPFIARMPPWLARPCWTARGVINFVFDWDWRTFSLERGYVRQATIQAMQLLSKLAARRASPVWLTVRRFVCLSREEVDCHRLLDLNYDNIKNRIAGLDFLLDAQQRGQGVVLITAHFDSLYIGLALLAKSGLRVNLMSTRLTEDPVLPPAVRAHFALKITSLNELLSPGKVVHSEDNIHFFVKALRRGEIVVIAGDGPSTATDRSLAVPFLGKRRLMAAGPQFLAERTGSFVSLYTCQLTSDQFFDISISPPTLPSKGGIELAYSLMETQLLNEPWRWWAADITAAYSADIVN